MAPHFVWQQPRPEPEFHHRVLRDFHKYWEMAAWGAARANRAPYGLFDKAKTYWRFYLGPFLTLPLLTVPWLWRRRRTRLLLLAGVFIALGLAVEVWHAPHYAAPALGLCLLLVIGGLRQLPHLRLWRRIHPAAGTWAVRAIVAGGMLTPVIGGSIWMDDGSARARIVRQFADQGRSHLVIVRYRLDHDSGDEWVYNAAGIDGAPIVWAREMDPTSNRALLRYFPNRRAWLLEPDLKPPRLTPYDPAMPPDPPFRFVKLGTEAVETLRSPGDLRRKILDKVAAEYSQPYRFSCDQWAYFFTGATGVESPEVAGGCFPAGRRGTLVSFEDWWAWMEQQR
jgi:hypothetical protein